MGKNRLSINLLANVISYSSSIIIAFWLTPFLIQSLGKEVYSFYPISNSFVNYMGIITTALNSMASRFVTIEIAKKNYKKASSYFSSVFFGNVLMSIALLIPIMLIVIYLQYILNIPTSLIYTVKWLFALVFLSMIINLLTSVFGIATFAKNRIDLGSLASIIVNVVRVFLFIAFFKFVSPNIIYVGVISILIGILTFFLQFLLTKKLLPEIELGWDIAKFRLIAEIISSGIWNSINQLGATLLAGLTLVISNIFLGAGVGAVYSIAQTVPTYFSGIISVLIAVFMPKITYYYAKKDKKEISNLVISAQCLLSFVNIPVAGLIIFGQAFYSLWVPNQNAEQLANLTSIIAIQYVYVAASYPLFCVNTVLNKVKIPAIVMVIIGIINLFFVYVMIKFAFLGIYSVAIANTIFSIILYVVFVPLYACYILKVKKFHFYKSICLSSVSFIIIVILMKMIVSVFDVTSWLSFILIAVVCATCGTMVHYLIMYKMKI